MLKYAEYTNIGKRAVNEDSFATFSKDERQCFVVCDGLGGHGMGDVASKLVKDVFGDVFLKSEDNDDLLNTAFETAEKTLLERQKELKAKMHMKTTAVVVLVDERCIRIGHIGDSRAYVFNKNKIKFQTLDHSVPQMLVLSKQIKESEIRNHPDRNILLRVMGVEWEEPMYELSGIIPLKKCQGILLCSDGFWENITEKEMCETFKTSKCVEEWLDKMISIVNSNGSNKEEMDNNSAIAIWGK